MRLDKLLEHEKLGSRKKVKQLFLRKQIVIDQIPAFSLNQIVDPELQTITVEGKQIINSIHVYYLLNKPKGVVTARIDAQKQTVIDLIHPIDRRLGLYPVGRLDRDSEGLMLLTTNGPLGYKLLHPTYHISKTYIVSVNGKLNKTDILLFQEGIKFEDGYICKPAKLDIHFSSELYSIAIVTINEGKFHQIKKMFLSRGKKVTSLKRLSMGPLSLPKELLPGEYRSLNKIEKQNLLPYF